RKHAGIANAVGEDLKTFCKQDTVLLLWHQRRIGMLEFHPFVDESRFIDRFPVLADQDRQFLQRIELRSLGVVVPRNSRDKLKGNAFLGELYPNLPRVRAGCCTDQAIHDDLLSRGPEST